MEKKRCLEGEATDKPRAKIIKLNHYSSRGEDSETPEANDSSQSKNDQSQNKKDSSESEKNSSQHGKDSSKEKEDKDKEEETPESDKCLDFPQIVASHYNSVETGFVKRNSSRIHYLRNFNNWIKSLLIKESARQIQEYNQRKLIVLDMCCGKGGDLFKWAPLNVKYMVCTDIAETSLEHYKTRYNDYMQKCQMRRRPSSLQCEFIPADCTRVRLRGKYHDPSIQFDIVSSQFSFHYGFESLPQVECMLKNASECLKPGGLFIGTIPNSYEIVKRLKRSGTNSLKNEIFSLEMCCSEPYPLFGAKYNFYLKGVVDCPEFLVHFPTFEKLAQKFAFQLVRKEKFPEFYSRRRSSRDGEILLRKIKALETYPPPGDEKLMGSATDYIHAKIYCEQNGVQQVGTLSQCEWDVASLYQTFVFKKVAAT